MDKRWKEALTNSDSKCLLENWVEERMCKGLDKMWKKAGPQSHPGLFSVFNTPVGACGTTYRSHYTPKTRPPEDIGAKTKHRSHEIRAAVKKEIEAEEQKLTFPTDYRSQTTVDFFNNPVPAKPKRSRRFMCELATEQPVTFWTDHYSKLHTISQDSKLVKPFRRNVNFSTPIEYKMDAPQPYEMKGYTSMQFK
ncbi:Sperm-associated antigen 8 [Sparganum proliferum]